MNNGKEIVSAAYTTLKEYDAAVRRSQRKVLNTHNAVMLGKAAETELELAKAAHKFLLACRAKFKETGVPVSADVLKQGLKAPDLSQAPKLRPEQEQALREAFERTPDPIPVTVLGVDPGVEPGKLFTPEGERQLDELARMIGAKRGPTAAEVQPLVPVDRSREFVPRARVIRERSHVGAMREPKYAADDCRNRGLGYRRLFLKGEQWRRTVALAVVPKFPSERGFTQRAMPNHSKRRIVVNGQVWA